MRQRAPWWMYIIAVSFIAYYVLLVYCDFLGPLPLGVLTEFSGGHKVVHAVFPNSPAERARLQIGDKVVALNGRVIRNWFDWLVIRVNLEAGRPHLLDIERDGQRLEVPLRLDRSSWKDWTSREGLFMVAVRAAQFVTLLLALVIAFSRPNDLVARVGAWFLASVATYSIVLPYGMAATWRHLPTLLGGLLWISLISALVFAPLGFSFFAMFPRRLFRSRWVWVLVWTPALLILPSLAHYSYLMVYQPEQWTLVPDWVLGTSTLSIPVYVLAGLIALVVNYRRLEDTREQRRVRVLVVGSVVGWLSVLPLFWYWWGPVRRLATGFFFSPVWILAVVLFLAFPLSFAYAVVKHRVLEIPALVKRSARYLLVQRGVVFIIFLLSAAATLTLVFLYERFMLPRMELAVPLGLTLGVGFGIILSWAGSQAVRRITERIDRAFFRSAFDAHQILQEVADQARVATNREALATLLELQLQQALHPRTLAVYLATGDGRFSPHGKDATEPASIPMTLPVLAELARRGQPWEVPSEGNGNAALSELSPLEPECLVPVLERGGRLTGLLVLGQRLSEEPYSGEDKRLLASVASQVGMALENIRMAEEMAERMEAERRASHELEIAKQVQSRLFPQKMPPIATLEYVGACFQARAVGGDYYDFLDLGPGRLALVVADISGKGISAALLMANLQAILRSQYALALEALPSLMQSVNKLLYNSTSSERYATLFIGTYEDATRRLRYVNCGHNPPVLLRADGWVERLEGTATVLGLFEKWECMVDEVGLAPGDLLVINSDGVPDARNDHGEEFGEDRLIEILKAHNHLPVPSLLETIVTTVQQFSGREKEDDLTLVVARAQ
jgi:sigma-B regulation protein RsbU (phosphoserine phosphatase)